MHTSIKDQPVTFSNLSKCRLLIEWKINRKLESAVADLSLIVLYTIWHHYIKIKWGLFYEMDFEVTVIYVVSGNLVLSPGPAALFVLQSNKHHKGEIITSKTVQHTWRRHKMFTYSQCTLTNTSRQSSRSRWSWGNSFFNQTYTGCATICG